MGIYLKQNKSGVAHTEHSIQRLLVRQFMSGAKYMVPNMFYRLGEMDMFLLRRSGYAEEFEIKCSTSDLRADFKKRRKHSCFTNCCLTGIPWIKRVPNRFSYVLSDAVDTSNIVLPEYAGLYVVHPTTNNLICLTVPRTMHKRKYNWHEKVAGSCSHRLLRAYKLRN